MGAWECSANEFFYNVSIAFINLVGPREILLGRWAVAEEIKRKRLAILGPLDSIST